MRKVLVSVFMFVMAADLSAQSFKEPLPEHPRILMMKGEEDAVKKTIASDKLFARVHAEILAESDKLIAAAPLERKLIGRRLLDVSREAIRRIFFLSYAYRMTGDDKYRARAEKELLAVVDFSDWHPDHFLDIAEMTTAVSIGYDWLYPSLSEENRVKIRKAIIEKGIEPSYDKKYNSWLRVTHNWNQVCNTGMAFGSVAVFETDPTLAKKTLTRSAESIKLPMNDYDPDGAFPEGYGYWGYGTTYNVLFLSLVERALGTDFGLLTSQKSFMKTASYMLNMTGNSGKPFNYSDSGTGTELHPAMFWFASRLKDLSLLFTERTYLERKSIDPKNRFLPAVVIWGSGLNLEKIPEPKNLSWVGLGRTPVAFMRSSWKNDGIYLAIKGGTPSTNHSHMDIGSFVMDALGIRWAMDFGMQSYETLESKSVDLWNMKQNSQRWKVLRYGNLMHNTLTFDNSLQLIGGNAKITRSSADPNFMSTQTDLSSLYSGSVSSAKRGVAICARGYVAVRDEIETNRDDALLRWSMITPADVAIQPDGSAVLTKDKKTLVVRVVSPKGITLTTWSTAPVNSFDAPNPGTIVLGFETKIPAQKKEGFTVLLIPQGSENLVKEIPMLEKWKKD